MVLRHSKHLKKKLGQHHMLLQLPDAVSDDQQSALEKQVLEAADKDPELMAALNQAAEEANAKGIPLDLNAIMQAAQGGAQEADTPAPPKQASDKERAAGNFAAALPVEQEPIAVQSEVSEPPAHVPEEPVKPVAKVEVKKVAAPMPEEIKQAKDDKKDAKKTAATVV